VGRKEPSKLDEPYWAGGDLESLGRENQPLVCSPGAGGRAVMSAYGCDQDDGFTG